MAVKISWKKVAQVVVIAEIVVLSTLATASILGEALDIDSRERIQITGNSEFTKANGVRSGSGTVDDPYVISDWKIDWSWTGIRIVNTTSHFVIRNCELIGDAGGWGWYPDEALMKGAWAAVSLQNVSGGDVTECRITSDYAGMHLLECHGIRVLNNSILESSRLSELVGIVIARSTDVTVGGNNLGSSGIFVGGSQTAHYSTVSIASDNLVCSKPVIYEKDRTSFTLSGVQAGQIIIANCTDFEVHGISLSNSSIGLLVAGSSNGTVADSVVSEVSNIGFLVYQCSNVSFRRTESAQVGSRGIAAYNCSRLLVIDSIFWVSGGNGIELDGCSDTTISNCTLTQNNADVYVEHGSNDTIEGSRLSSGMTLVTCSGTHVQGNTITGANRGLSMSYHTSNVTIHGNLFAGNSVAILVWENTTGTEMYGNTLVANTIQVEDKSTPAGFLNGSYDEGGNFWSNYTGPDVRRTADQSVPGSDGIIDIPYDVAGNLTDAYPLKAPPGEYADHPVPIIGVQTHFLRTSMPLYANATKSWDFHNLESLTFNWSMETWSAESTRSGTYVYSYSPGPHMLTLRATNTAGRVGETSIGVLTDDEGPSITVSVANRESGDGAFGFEGGSIYIHYVCRDVGSGFAEYPWYTHESAVKIYIDGVLLEDAGLSMSGFTSGYFNVQEGGVSIYGLVGFHEIKITATDAVWNTNESKIQAYAGPHISALGVGIIALLAGAVVVVGARQWEKYRGRPRPPGIVTLAQMEAQAKIVGFRGPHGNKDPGEKKQPGEVDKEIDVVDGYPKLLKKI